ncbi:SIR2 family NAD-dependent protein deacylase [Methylobacterium sp. MA0201]|uniref:SIR2 family NAD-dependent protein deacylase n=1 Tax=Methylobacterium alsaeris TaxID=3344826 RepID=UPI0037581090
MIAERTFADIALAYSRGALTPFLGSGISHPNCLLWPEFVTALEQEANQLRVVQNIAALRPDDPGTLIRRAERAVRILQRENLTGFSNVIQRILYRGEAGAVPINLDLLSKIWWPLVVTTNYDGLFLKNFNNYWISQQGEPLPDATRMKVRGRSPRHCQDVLSSLRNPDQPILWAIQGYVGLKTESRTHLADEIVVGHEEYRKQTYEAIHFRRTFAEIYRTRTLLFVGAGLQEPYFLDLFGEILQLLGPISHLHYAIIKSGSLDPEFLLSQYQIRAIEYDVGPDGDHSAPVGQILEKVAEAIKSPEARTIRWSFNVNRGPRTGVDASGVKTSVEIIRGDMPSRLSPNEAIVVSGKQEVSGIELSRAARANLDRLKMKSDYRLGKACDENGYVYPICGFKEGRGYAAIIRRLAEQSGEARDARLVGPVMAAVLDAATRDGVDRLHLYPLATGQRRTFPPYVSLMEILRAYRRWKSSNPSQRLRLSIHTDNEFLINLISSRRIDPLDMLSSSSIRFWIEITRSEENIIRIYDEADETTTLKTIFEKHSIPENWLYSVRPAPGKKSIRRQVGMACDDASTMESEGIFLGSVLRVIPPLGNGQEGPEGI